MQSTRIVNVLNEPWGRATVYTDEPEEVIKTKKLSSSLESREFTGFKSLSNIFEESEVKVTTLGTLSDVGNNASCLSYMLSSIFATILEDTITQLRILVEGNNELRIIKTVSDMRLLLSLKFGVKQPKTVDELDGVDPNNLGSNEYKINKLDADRNFFIDVLTATYVDLSIERKFTVLERCNNKIIDRDNYRVSLEEDEAKNKILRRDLNKRLRQQRNHIKTVIYDTDVIIDDIRTQVEDSVLNSECRSRYIDNWQRARTEQHIQTIDNSESVFTETIEYYRQRSDHEQRVHSEVELLVNIAINETLEKVEHWMNMYDKDMEKLDLKIQIKKNDYQNMMDKRINLEQTIEKHDTLMKEWIHFKEEREKARLYCEKMTNSAITVQAWWRGLLVRRQLGPYKVAKKKGGGKKK